MPDRFPALTTLIAALVTGLFLLIQQARHWRETRRDRVRQAYAEWVGRLVVLRRKDEQVMEVMHMFFEEAEARRQRGEWVGPSRAIEVHPQAVAHLQSVRREQHQAQHEEEVAFAAIGLLDNAGWRVRWAQSVKQMVPFEYVEEAGPPPSIVRFTERSQAQALALGLLTVGVARTLELEAYPRLIWPIVEWCMTRRHKALARSIGREVN